MTDLLAAGACAGACEASRGQAYGAPVATWADVQASAARLPGAVASTAYGRPAFTNAHFDGYPAVLLDLEGVGPTVLRELVTEAWVDRAPTRLVREHLGDPS